MTVSLQKVSNLSKSDVKRLVTAWIRGDNKNPYTSALECAYDLYGFMDINDQLIQQSDFLSFLHRKAHQFMKIHANDPTWRRKNTINTDKVGHSGDYWQKIIPLMLAYLVEGSDYYKNKKLRIVIRERLSWGHQFLDLGRRLSQNWWAWDIGVPRNLLKILLTDKEGEILTHVDKKCIMECLIYRGIHPKKMGFNTNLKSAPYSLKTGMNLLWVNYNMFQIALLLGNKEFLNTAVHNINLIIQEKEGWTGDGIAIDGTFHQHCPSKMTGINMGYGTSFVETGSLYFYFMDKLESGEIHIPASTKKAFFKLISFAITNCWGGNMNYWTKGRSLSRFPKKHRTGGFYDILDHMKPLIFTRYEKFKSSVLSALKQRGKRVTDALYPFIQPYYFSLKLQSEGDLFSADPDQSPSDEPNPQAETFFGCFHYPYGRSLVSRNQHCLIAVQANDLHHKTYFSIHGENKRGFHLNEGSIFFLTKEHLYHKHTQYAMPWHHIMGTTTIPPKHAIKEIHGYSKHVSLGSLKNLGSLGFYFRQNGIRAYKSYHIVGNTIILMFSNLHRIFEWKLKYWNKHVYTTLLAYPLDKSKSDGDESKSDGDKSKSDGDKNKSDRNKSKSDGERSKSNSSTETPLVEESKITSKKEHPKSTLKTTLFNGFRFKILPVGKEGTKSSSERAVDVPRILDTKMEFSVRPEDINNKYPPEDEFLQSMWRVLKIDHGRRPKHQDFACAVSLPLDSGKSGYDVPDPQEIERNGDPILYPHAHCLFTRYNEEKGKIVISCSLLFFQSGSTKAGALSTSGCLMWKSTYQKSKLAQSLSETVRSQPHTNRLHQEIRKHGIMWDRFEIFISPEVTDNILEKDEFPRTIRAEIPFRLNKTQLKNETSVESLLYSKKKMATDIHLRINDLRGKRLRFSQE